MSRRGRSGPTISLFSFQDIITSVTAIVTVITLLLALDLVRRTQSHVGDSSGQFAGELIRRLHQVESELSQLQSQTSTNDELVRELAKISPAELKVEIELLQAKVVERKREKQRVDELSETWQDRVKDKHNEQKGMAPQLVEAETLRRQLKELEQKWKEEQSDKRPLFSLPRGFQNEGWIVEVGDQQLLVAPIGRAAVPIKFTATGLSLLRQSAPEKFERWIESQNLRSDYFLFLIRPHCSAFFDEVISTLEMKRVKYGFDLIDDNQIVLHPERGAAP